MGHGQVVDTERTAVLFGGALVALAILDAVVDLDSSGALGLVNGGGPIPLPLDRISRRGWPWVGLIAPIAGSLRGWSVDSNSSSSPSPPAFRLRVAITGKLKLVWFSICFDELILSGEECSRGRRDIVHSVESLDFEFQPGVIIT